jgi:hypothetical protein
MSYSANTMLQMVCRSTSRWDEAGGCDSSGKNRITSSVSGCTRRTKRFGCNLLQPDAACHSTVRSDTTRQRTLRLDEECHGIYLLDEECQGIFLPDAAMSSRRSLVIWTQLWLLNAAVASGRSMWLLGLWTHSTHWRHGGHGGGIITVKTSITHVNT